MSTLITAITRHDADQVASLLARDPAFATERDAAGVSALMHALYHRDQPIIDQLLSLDPPLDVFELAALGRGVDLAQRLSADPTLVRAASADGYSPLHLAAFFGRAGCCAVLLDRGADPNAPARNASVVRPIHSAAAARSETIVAMLLERGADPNTTQRGGYTALHAAAHNGDVRLAALLIACGADRDALTDSDASAYDLARGAHHEAVCALLR
jgi:uncharacterized protein